MFRPVGIFLFWKMEAMTTSYTDEVFCPFQCNLFFNLMNPEFPSGLIKFHINLSQLLWFHRSGCFHSRPHPQEHVHCSTFSLEVNWKWLDWNCNAYTTFNRNFLTGNCKQYCQRINSVSWNVEMYQYLSIGVSTRGMVIVLLIVAICVWISDRWREYFLDICDVFLKLYFLLMLFQW